MKKILVVDDQPVVSELITLTFETQPYQILMAADGESALALARAELPDLILLDIMMPGSQVDGLEVCRLIKHDPATQHIGVVLLTAKGQVWDQQAGREAGADGYIVKPFSPLELLDRVNALLAV